MYQATKHLIDLGHRRIAFLGDNGTFASRNRVAGYQKALQERDLPFHIEESDGLSEAVAQATRRLLQLRGKAKIGSRAFDFTALVCRNDLIAMTAVQTMQQAGLKIPDHISVVGFDDISPQYDFRPAITSLNFNRVAMGKRAVELLCDDGKREQLLRGTTNAQAQHETFATKLVIRNSTCPPSKRP